MPESRYKDPVGKPDTHSMPIELVYAKPDEQVLIGLKIACNSTVEQAILASDLLKLFPEIDLKINRVGIFGRETQLNQTLRPNDRIEIYRPLIRDPKDTRRLRATKQ